MNSTFKVFNADFPSKTMTLTKGFSTLPNCLCTSLEQKSSCEAYNVQVHYADLCRTLDFNPQMPLYTSADPQRRLRVWYPWEYPEGDGPLYTETWWGWGEEKDYNIENDPFAWIDRVEPTIRIPIHMGMPNLVGIKQPQPN